jgi:DHA1 family bicyclomycin/chloramphenicol resistance-like MFS transporter
MALALDARFDWGGLTGLTVPLLIYLSALEFIVANSVAGAPADFPHMVGAVSALVAATLYGVGVLSAAMIGWFADSTP